LLQDSGNSLSINGGTGRFTNATGNFTGTFQSIEGSFTPSNYVEGFG
jgi:hypothetical protein